MSIRYLLDINIISDPTRLTPNPQVYEKLKTYRLKIAIPCIVYHELLFGMNLLENSSRKTLLQKYLDHVLSNTLPILPYTEQTARWHAQERARLQKIGIQTSFPNGQIASIAFVNNLIIVTRNENDFKHFKGIQVENWFDTIPV